MSGLDLGIIGNCAFGALIDRQGQIVWCCLPRFDSDPVFNALMRTPNGPQTGGFALELEDLKSTEQFYEPNTAVLRTRLHGPSGSIEITDSAPRFLWRNRMFRPHMIVRRVTPISGRPRITIRCRPTFHYGRIKPSVTHGSNHIRFVGPELTLRLTTDAPIDYVLSETTFNVDEPINLILGPDETLSEGLAETARHFEEQTIDYWRNWSRRLALPFDWQDAVVRAAITLKKCTYEPTGAIVAALTTSIPEAANSGRNWDYRYCWLRDAFFVVRALNSLAAVHTMENYFGWLTNVVAQATDGHLQPVYGIGLEKALIEGEAESLPGYRGMGPVRIGNQAYEHFQHDVYGNVILGASQAFFDERLFRPATLDDFHLLERVGERAFALHAEPDAGMWELRTRARVHTSSSLMCWAACDRLAKIAQRFEATERAAYWRGCAETVRKAIFDKGWNEASGSFVESFGGTDIDAGLLLMAEVGFLAPDDKRFVATVDRIGKELKIGNHLHRYVAPDDFGRPRTAFNICTFWYIDALARIGRTEEAREIFETMLGARNHLGLLSEDVDPSTGELWGNYPQTYSMVGIINGAVRLSRRWDTVT